MDTLITVLVIGAFALGGLKALVEMLDLSPTNPHLTCKFCHVKGRIRVTDETRKQGISGGKATGAVLTGGASMLVTGLSRKQPAKHLKCRSCSMEWDEA